MACDPALIALIDAYEASGSLADRNALVEYVESASGQIIDDLLSPEWSETAADGVTRNATRTVAGCSVTFTIDATLVGEPCESLPRYTMELPVRDFHLGVLSTGTLQSGTSWERWELEPEYDIHLENPRLQWLHTDSSSELPSEHVQGFPDNIESPSGSGDFWYPYIRVNGYITATIARVHDFDGVGNTHTFHYELMRPGFAFKLLRRNPSGGSAPTIDDPIEPGTISLGTVSSSDYPTHGTNQRIVPSDESASSQFWLPPAWADPQYESPFFSGSGATNSSSAVADGAAWADFMGKVEDYNAARGIYDPTLEVDEDTKVATIGFEGKDNAMYYAVGACLLSGAELLKYEMLTINWGGYYHHKTEARFQHKPTYESGPGDILGISMDYVQQRVINDTDEESGSTHSDWNRVSVGTYSPFLSATATMDGTPPTVIPNPPLITPKPISGGCKATIDGPSSCNFNVPVEPDPDSPDFPDPGDLVEPDIPDFEVPEMPVVDVDVPTFPPIDCLLPDLGNLSDCEPGPGSGAGLPGGRDRSGKRGAGLGGIKTGGPTYNNRDYNFRDNFPDGTIDPDTGEPIVPPQRSWPEGSSVMTAITVILLDLKISPLNIIFEVGPEWDKTFGPKTFPEHVRMFDAAQWLASLIMCRIIDEGDGKVYIGPITHRPGQNTWTFNSQFPNADGDPPMFGLGYGASMGEAYYAVEVWGAHLGESVFALVDTPFSVDPQNILQIEVGPDYSLEEAQELAAFRAGLIRREAVMVQVEVPYSQEYFMRDKVILKFPDRGLQSDYILFGKQSEFSIEKRVHILNCVLPATLEELENFPEVMGEGMNAIDMGFA